MTDEERFDRMAAAIERVADVSSRAIQRLEQAHLGLVAQVGLLADITRRIGEQQAEIRQRQIEQDQRFDILLGEIRHIVRGLDEGSR